MATTEDAIELLNEAEQTADTETPAIDDLLTTYGLDSDDVTATKDTAGTADPSEEAGATGLLEYFAPGEVKSGDEGGDKAEEAGTPAAAGDDKATDPATGTEGATAKLAATSPTDDDEAAVEEKPGEPTGLDSSLTDEEKALVESRPEAERATLEGNLRAAKFEHHFRSARPVEEIGRYLASVSETRAKELGDYFVTQAITNPERLETALQRVATEQPEAYRDFVVGLLEGNIRQFTAETTGTPGVDINGLKTAVRFYEAHKEHIDKLADPADFDFEGAAAKSATGEFDDALLDGTDLSPDEMADLKEWVPEIADKVKAVLARGAQAAPPAAGAETQPPPPPPTADTVKESEKPTDVATTGVSLEVIEGENNAFMEGYTHLDTHLRQFATREAGIAVGSNEEKLAPEVATLKRVKGEVLFSGMGDTLPPFEKGLLAWVAERDDRTKAAVAEILRDMGHFTKAREGKNVVSAAQRMAPYAERYMRERLKHPVLQRLDAAIERMAGPVTPATDAEPYLPAGAASVSQTPKPTDADTDFFEMAVNYQEPQS